MNAEFGATAFAQRQGAAGVIAVNMREQNLGDFLNAHGFSLLDDAVHVRVGAERDVDNQPRLFADDILIGPLQSHEPGIIGGEFTDEVGRSHGVSFRGKRAAAQKRMGKKKRQRGFP